MMNTKSIRNGLFFAVLIMLCLAVIRLKTPSTVATGDHNNMNLSGKAEISEAYGRLPICFEANQGQIDEQVSFMARGNGYALFLSPQEAVLSLQKPITNEQSSIESQWKSQMVEATSDEQRASSVIRLELVGANPAPRIQGLEELPGKVNHIKGNDPTRWRTNVATYAKVKYQSIYSGVDLVYYGNQQELEYDFIVAPGADLAKIKLGFAGVDKLEVDSRGDLVMHVAEEQVRMHKPIIYQEQDGVREEISGGYKLIASMADDHEGNGLPQVGFQVEAYDSSEPLIIDPILNYSTFLGGSDQDISNAIAVDGAGNAYITGLTSSLDFPVANALQPVFAGLDQDIFVTKLDLSGSALVYSTYLGGSRRESGFDITVDAAGNAYVSGWTQSSDFPLMNPTQPVFGGGDVDAIVFKLNPSGSALVFSTFLGGTGTIEYGNAICVDAAGNVHVAGATDSPNFPTVNAKQPVYAGGTADAFVAEFNAAGSALIYSSYLGGNGLDSAQGIVVDNAGNAYLTGVTDSPNFPTANALQPVLAGLQDIFITKLNPSTSTLAYSTFLGGSAEDIGTDIGRDASGNLYVTGQTASADFPTANALQPALAGGRDAIVVKLNSTASALIYSTFLGGSLDEYGRDLAVDGAGSVYVAGWTLSSDFPTVNAPQPNFAGGVYDGIFAKLNPAGSDLVYSTYFGGNAEDRPTGLALDVHGAAYVTGLTFSTDLPILNAFQPIHHGLRDVFITKLGITPRAQIQSIITEVEFLVNTGVLNQGQGNALISKLEAAIKQLDKGNIKPAINELQVFINQVTAFMNSDPPILTPAEGQPLIDAANTIIAALNNSQVAKAGFQADASDGITAVDQTNGLLPTGFQLEQNSPNPFNSMTRISFTLPETVEVSLAIYSVQGQLVCRLIGGLMNSGYHSIVWNARDEGGHQVTSGVYVYVIKAGNFIAQKKLLFVK